MTAKGSTGKPIPEHGTRQRYNHRLFKCRCVACREANTAWTIEYRNRVRLNGTVTYKDADGKWRMRRLPR